MDEVISYAFVIVNEDPETFKEVMESPDNESWMQGMLEEMKSLRRRCSDNWLKMGVHKEVTIFGARWSEI